MENQSINEKIDEWFEGSNMDANTLARVVLSFVPDRFVDERQKLYSIIESMDYAAPEIKSVYLISFVTKFVRLFRGQEDSLWYAAAMVAFSGCNTKIRVPYLAKLN